MDWQKNSEGGIPLGMALCPIVYAHLCMVYNRLLLDLSFSEQTSACEAKNDVIFMFKLMSHQNIDGILLCPILKALTFFYYLK